MGPFTIGLMFLMTLALECSSTPQAAKAMLPYLEMLGEDLDSDEDGQFAGERATNCSCGWTNKARIVGGKETLKNEFPLIAGIVARGTRDIFCGSTILTQKHVVTAAHCTHEDPNLLLSVVIGEHDQSEDGSIAQVIDVEKVIEHEYYSEETFHNDIALLVLSRKIEFNQLVGPACLPTGRTNLVHEYVKVLGWGRMYTRGPVSNVLRKVNLRVLPIDACVQSYIRSIPTKEDAHQVCTFMKKKDSCQGDSGGPVLWLDPQTNRYTLVALVSYGKKCGLRSPAVNTDVSFFVDWLQRKITETDASLQTCSKV